AAVAEPNRGFEATPRRTGDPGAGVGLSRPRRLAKPATAETLSGEGARRRAHHDRPQSAGNAGAGGFVPESAIADDAFPSYRRETRLAVAADISRGGRAVGSRRVSIRLHPTGS